MPALDYAAAWAFAEALGPDQQLTLQSFDDGADKRRELAAINGGKLAALWPWVQRQQERGCGIFATVNATAAGRRKAADVTAVRALFCDFDRPRQRDWHLRPSVVVQSGHGEHAYWLTADCPLDQFRAAQQRLAAHYGSDPAVNDLSRVMRLPGTLWQKLQPPRPVLLLDCRRIVYQTAALLDGIAALPAPARVPLPERRHAGGHGVCDTKGFDALRYFDDAGAILGRDPKHAAKLWIVCPWHAAHTQGRQGPTDTLLFADDKPRLWCNHASCRGRGLRDLLAELDAATLSRYCPPKPSYAVTRAEAQARRYEAP